MAKLRVAAYFFLFHSHDSLAGADLVDVLLLQSALQLGRETTVAGLTARSQVHVVEATALAHRSAAEVAGEVPRTPALVQRGEHVARDQLRANVTGAAEQLLEVWFAVGLAVALVVRSAEERLFTLGTDLVRSRSALEKKRFQITFDSIVAKMVHKTIERVLTK